MSSPQCFENPPALVPPRAGSETVHELAGLKAYVAGPPDSKRAVILIADVFGYEAPNLRKFADRCASSGFLVVVPDFFYGDPIDANNFDKIDRDAWRKIHNTEKGYEDALKVVKALKSKGVSAVGASGYCWGGVVVAKLAGSGELQAGVILHPGKITEDEIKAVKTPTAILGAEIDHSSPPDILQKYGEILSAKSEFESYVKIFPRVPHGWSMRYKEDDEFAIKSAEEAHQDTLNWFLKHVK
ncbi:hypothetical protein MLD38_039658 [Melastoma candidum]|uniref:Uncharacterized protein n=1 Tax=Melastoma candidum TaxID=119954 RepID=A0ACB9L408_9MYRT|nr:hypothetical protein MLD38_039658 [Melastoma candidum]